MVQVVNLVTNRVSRILGKVENTERFLRVALYQGIPKQGIKTQRTLATTESTRTVTRQPTLLCTAYNKQRLYLFTIQEPDDSDQASTSRSVECSGLCFADKFGPLYNAKFRVAMLGIQPAVARAQPHDGALLLCLATQDCSHALQHRMLAGALPCLQCNVSLAPRTA